MKIPFSLCDDKAVRADVKHRGEIISWAEGDDLFEDVISPSPCAWLGYKEGLHWRSMTDLRESVLCKMSLVIALIFIK